MNQVNLFIDLVRLKKPIGFMLLFWPCSWGLVLGFDFNQNYQIFFFYLLLFFLGSILMRSAGCIINDIFDRDFDKKVLRTKDRPIASGKISINLAFTYASILCILAFFVLINFNYFTIILALCSMPLAFSYPLMKRYTYWPQLFLGITFNYGLVLGWTSIQNEINMIPIILYAGAIFWTLGYDTIYGYQDIEDDEIIGVKSTSIKFKNNPKKFLTLCYSLFLITILTINFIMNFNILIYLIIFMISIHLIVYQISNFDIQNKKKSLILFKSNNFLGFLVFINFLLGKIY